MVAVSQAALVSCPIPMGAENEDKLADERRDRSASQPPVDPADDYVRSAWRTWLSALAADAEAAMAASLAYEALPSEGRDAWLEALEVDAPALEVPTVALYAPLLAVESDVARRDRIQAALTADPVPRTDGPEDARALRGVAGDGTHACVLVAPVYLEFVQVLTCRYTPSGGFVAVRHDPFRHAGDLLPMRDVDGVAVEPTPLHVVVEELAHAILADRRERRVTPAALASFVHLFAPQIDDGEDAARSEP
jgi:hypothetical protein